MKLLVGSPLSFFVRSLLPNFSKSTVHEQIEILKNENQTKVLPVYENAVDFDLGFRGKNAFKHKWNIMVNDTIMDTRNLDTNNREFKFPALNCIELVYNVMANMEVRLKHLDELVKKSFGDDIVNANLTFSQAQLIRLVEMTEFVLVYSRRLLIMMIHNEYSHLSADAVKTTPLVKGDVKWLETNIKTFAMVIAIYSQPKENFIRALKAIPNMEIPETKEEYSLAEKVHGNNIDPLGMGFIPYVLNPIFHVKNAILHWRNYRIESAKAEREYIELRLQQYRLKLGGADNAKMEQVIANTEERLKRLNKKISDMEEDYAATYGV